MVQKTRATFSTNQIENLPVYQSWLVTRVFPRFMQFACCFTGSSNWLVMMSTLAAIGCLDYFDFSKLKWELWDHLYTGWAPLNRYIWKSFKLFRDGILQDIEHEENILENVSLPMKSLSVNNVTFALRYFSISIPCYAFFQ